MADAPAARDIYNLPLAELTAAELHARGIAKLSQSLARQEHDQAGMLARQAQALFWASLSARDVTAEREPGAHRSPSLDNIPPMTAETVPGPNEFTGHHS
jgi:hypothetical protein